MEDLQRAIYYSSHSWCDDLPLLEQCLVKISAAYGDYIPVHKDYPVCPVLFSEEGLKRHEKEFEDIVYMEEFLDVQTGNEMKKQGHLVGRDGSISLEDFDAAKKAEELLVSVLKDKDKEQEKRIRRYWTMREGKFVLTMESCV